MTHRWLGLKVDGEIKAQKEKKIEKRDMRGRGAGIRNRGWSWRDCERRYDR